MKNILFENTPVSLHGRLLYSTRFVKDADIAGKAVLDVGCGYGWCEANFLKRGVRSLIATEISEKDLKTVKKSIYDKRVKYAVADVLNLPFADKSFDTVLAWDVIEHVARGKEGRMFEEVARVLKGGGVFYLSCPYKSLVSVIFDPAWWLADHRHYSREQLATLGNSS